MRKQIHLQCQLLKAAKSDDAKKLPSPPKDWKHSSNYFKNAFNRDEFGPVIKLKAPMSPKVDGEDMESNFQYWVGQIDKKKNPQNVTKPMTPKPSDSHYQFVFEAVASMASEEDKNLSKEDGLSPEKIETPDQPEVALRSLANEETFSMKNYPFEHPEKKVLISTSSSADFSQETIRFSRKDNRPARFLPSVSQILKETMPPERKKALQDWEERMIAEMGLENFMKMQDETLQRGNLLHSALEHFFFQGSLPDPMAIKDGISRNHLSSIGPIIDCFHRPPLSIESQVIHPDLDYVGYFDALTFLEDTAVLIDWKTSKKEKLSLRATFDAPLQVAAYVGALNHDARYPFQIENAMIVVIYNDGGKATMLKLNKLQLQKHWIQWLERCKLYKRIIK